MTVDLSCKRAQFGNKNNNKDAGRVGASWARAISDESLLGHDVVEVVGGNC